jgi:hypothetical protein
MVGDSLKREMRISRGGMDAGDSGGSEDLAPQAHAERSCIVPDPAADEAQPSAAD